MASSLASIARVVSAVACVGGRTRVNGMLWLSYILVHVYS